MQSVRRQSLLAWSRRLGGMTAQLAAFAWCLNGAGQEAPAEIKGAVHPPEPPIEYGARVWQTDDGLPHNLVRSIAQTRDGYLWVGTKVALARFDGIHFTLFDERNTPALKFPNITALCLDREGTLWIGTFGGGLVRLKDGIFTGYSSINGLIADHVSSLCTGKDGTVWIGTTVGLSRFKDGQFKNYTTNEGLASPIVRSVCTDPSGDVWVTTGEGLNRLHGDVMKCYGTADGLPSRSTRGLFVDSKGRLWIGSDSGTICYENGKFRAYGRNEGLTDGFVQAFCEDQQGELWVGAYGGLRRFRNGRFFDQLDSEGTPYDLINVLFEDREGDIWAGSREGLIRLIPKRFSAFTKRQGLSHDNVMCAQEDHLGNLWFGTWGGGLNLLSGDSITNFNSRNGFPHDLILSTCEGKDGSMWAGTDYEGGLIHLKDGKTVRYTSRNGLNNGSVRVLHEDRDGALWVGTSKGLSCLRDGKFTQYPGENIVGEDVIRAICEDHLGNLWFGTEDNLRLWKDGKFTVFDKKDGLSSSVIVSLYADATGDLWIGTIGGGLNRLHNGHFTSYTRKQGLFNNDVLEIIEDDSGCLWLSCSKGLSRVPKEEFEALDQGQIKAIHAVSYSRLDGLISIICNGISKPAGCKDSQGRIWFPTTKGLVVVNPRVRDNDLPPPVFIEQVVIDKHAVNLVEPSPGPAGTNREWTVMEKGVPRIRTLQGNGGLEIHYAALSLRVPEKNYFKYQLEGIDTDWVDARAQRAAIYNHVPPGSYRFNVMACNNDGVWNLTPASVVIELLPHFWQTASFRLLTGLGFVGALAGSVRYLSLRKIRRRLAALENQHAIEKERTRIARDIHDDLGSRLTQITLLSDRSEEESVPELRTNSRKISAAAREMAQSLDEIVWAINPAHDTLRGLAEYLTQSADDFLEDTPIRGRLKLPEQLPDRQIPAEVRHQLFLAFREALNNAVKHGKPSEIQIEMAADPEKLLITIADNGRGFDPAAPGGSGNGLPNMRERLESIGGHFEIRSGWGLGTRIKFEVGLNGVPPTNGNGASPPL